MQERARQKNKTAGHTLIITVKLVLINCIWWL